ncbi:hypothetical protein, conserved [Plasmodium gonderi]|uniref:RlmI-like PUA domain-containing protein n=1 Tax=Plasmodium gonderi TaxID=77519 RepID=A0A1Y1JKZ9_PLAGO|nr:hypothetical protein, conserved [Plasmodium gonderi]GAW82308.1 hypothetical protein, conserved [Plasmodium gonderi]
MTRIAYKMPLSIGGKKFKNWHNHSTICNCRYYGNCCNSFALSRGKKNHFSTCTRSGNLKASCAPSREVNNNGKASKHRMTPFLDEYEMKIIHNKRITFSSEFKNRINVFLKPLEEDVVTCDEVEEVPTVHTVEKDQVVIMGKNIDNSEVQINTEMCSKIGDRYINKESEKKSEKIEKEKTFLERVNRKKGEGSTKNHKIKFLPLERYIALTKNKHKYVYDFEIKNIGELGKYEAGEIVNIYFYNKEELGIGILNRKSNIVLRIIDTDMKKTINDHFFLCKLYESIKRRFQYLYKNISIYNFMHSLKFSNGVNLYCKVVNSTNDDLPGLSVYIIGKNIFIRYDNLGIQKFRYLIENELDTIFSPKNIFCKKIVSKKEKRAQQGKEYIFEPIKGEDLELSYSENGLTFYNNISDISYDIFHIENKQDRLFLRSICHSYNILNVNGNVGEYIISCTSIPDATNTSPHSEEIPNVSIILSKCAKNVNYIDKNISRNTCGQVMCLYREDILDELNNMHLNNLRFGLIIYNICSNIVYRTNSYTSMYGKRHTASFKGIHKYLFFLSYLLQKNGLLFLTVQLSAQDYDKFLNIVKCVFERKKRNLSIIYENSCSLEDNILCNDSNTCYLRSVCFRLGHS